MRLGLVSTALATCLATSAFAADLPSRQAPPRSSSTRPCSPGPVFMSVSTPAWAGLTRASIVVNGPTAGSSGVLSGVGGGDGRFVGGGQIGYNWQSGAIVYGLETDIQYVDAGGSVAWGPYTWWGGRGGGDGAYFGTVRARIGYAFDRTLIYVTGGLAYGGLNTNPLTGNTHQQRRLDHRWRRRIRLHQQLDRQDRRPLRRYRRGTERPRPSSIRRAASLPAGTYTATSNGGGGAGLLRVGVNYKF